MPAVASTAVAAVITEAVVMGAVLQLRELFPQHSHSQLQAVLADCSGQLDTAAEKLLQQVPAGHSQVAFASASQKDARKVRHFRSDFRWPVPQCADIWTVMH